MRDVVELHLTPLGDESWRTRAELREKPIVSGAESFLPGTASFRVRVDDVAGLHHECARQAVVHPKAPLREQPWGDTEFASARAPSGGKPRVAP